MDGRQGEASATRQLPPVLRLVRLGSYQVKPFLVGSLQQLFPDTAAPEAPLLSARHRPQGEVARPSREGLGHPAHEKQVRRAGKEELPWLAMLVYGPFDCMQEVRLSLHLIKGNGLAAPQERIGVASRQVDHIQVVQG